MVLIQRNTLKKFPKSRISYGRIKAMPVPQSLVIEIIKTFTIINHVIYCQKIAKNTILKLSNKHNVVEMQQKLYRLLVHQIDDLNICAVKARNYQQSADCAQKYLDWFHKEGLNKVKYIVEEF